MRRPLLVLLLALPALADEGMWTFNDFPAAKVKAKYGFAPDQAWLDRVRLASVRLAGGCSASLVSKDGLVMTNHHCVRDCVQELSGVKKTDLVKSGFFAKTRKEELRCETFELDQLERITDVTPAMTAATQGLEAKAFAEAQKGQVSRLEKECQTSDELRCEVVSLWHGGRYDLYRYRRYQDVRLVFAPEDAAAFFGGDPDNFMFPRYDLDVGFLRVYGRDGKPLETPEHLRFSTTPLQEGQLTFTSGHPGGTSRLDTVAELEEDRDVELPRQLARLSEWRGLVTEYQHRGPEQKRHSTELPFELENAIKSVTGEHQALADRAFFQQAVAREKALRAKVEANPEWKQRFGAAWDEQAKALARRRELHQELALERGLTGSLFSLARTLVRLADEREKPNPERLAEYADAQLPALRQWVGAKTPLFDELETFQLAHALVHLREELGADHPVVRRLFQKSSPEALAAKLVKGTTLEDPKARLALFDGGRAKVGASQDPLLALVRSFDAEARAIRKQEEAEVDGPLQKAAELLAQARFAVYGTGAAPDATFTLRLSYGAVRGYVEHGRPVAPFTTFRGAFERHTGQEPFALPRSWLDARQKLHLDFPFNVVTDNDIVGGNSGSPLVDQSARVVGLAFDGNLQSLGGEYGFEEGTNRAVAVTATALLEALDVVYGAKRLTDELRAE